jgi:hypothetical protein
MRFRCPFQILASTALLVGSIPILPLSEKTYAPKSAEEAEVLYRLIALEISLNSLVKHDPVCLSLDGLEPSPQFVESLRQQDLNVHNSTEQKEPNCSFEVQLEIEHDSSQSIRVRSKVFDFRANNKTEGNLALLEDGEYMLQKLDGKWLPFKYINHWQPGIAEPSGGWFEDDCTGTSFNINKISSAPGERIFLRLGEGTPGPASWVTHLGRWWAIVQGMHCSRDGECKDAKQAKALLDKVTNGTDQVSGLYTLDVGDQHFQGYFVLDYRRHPVGLTCE